jgi:hypothetical protein
MQSRQTVRFERHRDTHVALHSAVCPSVLWSNSLLSLHSCTESTNRWRNVPGDRLVNRIDFAATVTVTVTVTATRRLSVRSMSHCIRGRTDGHLIVVETIQFCDFESGRMAYAREYQSVSCHVP